MSMLMFPKCFLAEFEGNLNLVNTDIVSFKSGSGSSMFIYIFSKQLYKKIAFIILSGSKFLNQSTILVASLFMVRKILFR